LTIAAAIAQRNIEEVVHFTTSHGCLGTLYTKLLQSRQRLGNDPMVEYLFKANAALRKDVAYLDYVNLSLCHINTQFYDISSASWHREEPIFWCILAFDPAIITHEGVMFTTTNNMYTSVRRLEGVDGLTALYADRVERWTSNIVPRHPALLDCFPTCPQAEVLYPQAVSTEYLQRIYVNTLQDQSEVIGFVKATFHRDIEVLVEPDKFGNRPI
jgi:hypothetical protein